MEKTKQHYLSIQEAMDKGKGKVSIRGWAYRERKSNKLAFIVLRDGTNIIQCVFDRAKFSDEQWAQVDKLLIESSLEVEGEIKEDKRAPSGYEIQVESFRIEQI